MMTIQEMKKSLLNNPFLANADVTDLNAFNDWLNMRYEEMSKMHAKMLLEKKEDEELYEWVLSHCAAFGEVLVNFKKAINQTSQT